MLRFLPLLLAVAIFLPAPAQAFDCGQLQGAWQARQELGDAGWSTQEEALPFEANTALYKEYFQERLLAEPGSEPCDVDDALVRVINPFAEVLKGRITVEEFSARFLANDSASEAIWDLDYLVGHYPDFTTEFIAAHGDMPVFLVGDLLTASITLDSDATFRLWLLLFTASDGMYAEEFATNWIYQLFRDKPDVVLANMDDLMPHELMVASSFCWMMSPAETAELRDIYVQYADNENARVVLDWLACPDSRQ